MLLRPFPPNLEQRFHDQLLLNLRHDRHPFDAGVLVGDSRLGDHTANSERTGRSLVMVSSSV